MLSRNLEDRSWKELSTPWLFFLGVSLVTLGYAWRAQFSVDLTDEPFYLVAPFKLFFLGDRPFVNEIYNAPRQADILNHLFIASWLPYSVLAIRIAAILFYSVVLSYSVYVFFQKKLHGLAFLTFTVCFLSDFFLLPTWSYNWWCRNFLLLHLTLLMRASSASSGRYLFLAGLSLGVAAVAYNSIAAAFLVFLSALAFSRKRKEAFIVLVGGAVAIVPMALYILSPGQRSHWIYSLSALQESWGYQKNSFLQKLYSLVNFLFLSPVAGNQGAFSFQVLRAFVLSGITGGILLLLRLKRDKPFVTAGILVAFCTLLIIGLSSANGALALYWAIPSLLIPSVGYFASQPREKWVTGIVVVGLSTIAWGTFQNQRLHSYYDVPPGNCLTTLHIPPLQGLKTSEKRATYINELSSLVGEKNFVMSFSSLAGPFYFGNARPSLDTVLVDGTAPSRLHIRSIENAIDRKRFPELVIYTKVHPWYWGIEHPLAWTPSPITSDDALLEFTNCVRLKSLVNRTEYEVIVPDVGKFSACLNHLKNALPPIVAASSKSR